MTKQQIAVIRARWACVTPGPWMREMAEDGEVLPNGDMYRGDWYETKTVVQKPTAETDGASAFIAEAKTDVDACAIASAPSDIAALLAEIDRLHAVFDSITCMAAEGPDVIGTRAALSNILRIAAERIAAE